MTSISLMSDSTCLNTKREKSSVILRSHKQQKLLIVQWYSQKFVVATNLKHIILSVLDNVYLTQKTCFGVIYSAYNKSNEQRDKFNILTYCLNIILLINCD